LSRLQRGGIELRQQCVGIVELAAFDCGADLLLQRGRTYAAQFGYPHSGVLYGLVAGRNAVCLTKQLVGTGERIGLRGADGLCNQRRLHGANACQRGRIAAVLRQHGTVRFSRIIARWLDQPPLRNVLLRDREQLRQFTAPGDFCGQRLYRRITGLVSRCDG